MIDKTVLTRHKRMLADAVLDRVVEVAKADPERNAHIVAVRNLRATVETALYLFEVLPGVEGDDITIGFDEVGIPFQPRLADLKQLDRELHEALREDDPCAVHIGDTLAWIEHLARLHHARVDLAWG